MDSDAAKKEGRICVVVLGDIGRSPRIQYHSISLAREGFEVDIIAYGGSTPSQRLLENANITLHLMRDPPRSISREFEVFFGKKASGNLCVTRAMQHDLEMNWGIRAKVLYDRPPETFRQVSIEEKHNFFNKLAIDHQCFRSIDFPGETLFTKETAHGIEYRKLRPALLVSSTSWTDDEDFSILLDALQAYEMSIVNDSRSDLPNIVCVITGKGPLKEHYVNLMATKRFQHVQFCTPWLTAEDYPKVLASADIGVCLHTSSSGLDLPMKVVDMFGCGLPVLAYDFKCISELVIHGENGMVFHEPTELKLHLQTLLSGFPQNTVLLKQFSSNLRIFGELSWHNNWKTEAMTMFID